MTLDAKTEYSSVTLRNLRDIEYGSRKTGKLKLLETSSSSKTTKELILVCQIKKKNMKRSLILRNLSRSILHLNQYKVVQEDEDEPDEGESHFEDDSRNSTA